MPRDITVTFSDGSSTVYRGAPDDLTPEQAAQRAAQDHPGLQVQKLDGGRPAGNLLTQTGASLAAGATGAAGFLGKLSSIGGDRYGEGPSLRERVSQNLSEFSEQLASKYGLENPWGKAAAEGVGGGLLFGGYGAVPVVSNAIGGVTAEGAARLAGDNPAVRFFGGLAGGIGSAMGLSKLRNMVSPQLANLSARAMEDLTPDLLQQAAKLQAEAKAKGVSMDLAQAVTAVGGKAANLTRLRDSLSNAKEGQEVQRFLEAQPSQLREYLQSNLKIPGASNYGEQQAANNLQEAATKAVEGAKKVRADAVRSKYAQAGDLPEGSGTRLAEIAQRLANEPGATDEVKAAAAKFIARTRGETAELVQAVTQAKENLQKISLSGSASAKGAARAELQAAQLALEASKSKPLRALDVDTWIGDIVGEYKGTPLNPTNTKVRGQTKHMGTELNREFKTLSPGVRAAEAEFARLSDEIVNPIKQSVTGKIAQPRGYLDNIEAQQSGFNSIMQHGADPNAANSPIVKLAVDTYKTDPNAFKDRLQAYISARINEASDAGGSAAATANNQDLPQRAFKALFGNVQQAQGMRDAVATMAKLEGRDPHAAVAGLDKIIAVTSGLRSRVAPGGMSPEDIMQEGGHSMLATGVRALGQPAQTAGKRIEFANLGRAFSHLDKILTTPEGYLLLQKAAAAKTQKDVLTLLSNFGAASALGAPQPAAGQ